MEHIRSYCSSLSTKHNNNPNPDLISDLPDSLLLQILSLLEIEEVIKTSLLSRRWRYLWKSIPCLCFNWWFDCSTNFIDKCLFHHEGSKIQKLHISYNCVEDEKEENELALLVDSWIHFAMKCKVEDFKLDLLSDYDDVLIPYDEFYKLHYSFYLCITLTSLTLCGCNLNLPDSFQLGSLKKLSLIRLELYSDSVEHFSSNCPLLEEIYLKDCNRGRDLNIVITNENVKRLEISEYGFWGDVSCDFVKINAPTLLWLGIYECDPNVRFHVKELGSLMSVDLSGGPYLKTHNTEEYIDRNSVEELLYDLRHVKHLKLCSLCIQVLSFMKVQSVNLLSISATCLELKASLEKWEFPGISYLLQSCSNLEKLKIVNENWYNEIQVSNKFIEKHDFVEEEYWASETVVPTIMQNIKSIEIDLGSKSRHEEFVRFLLKNAKVLESMIINTPKRYANNFELLFKFTQRLIAFPRSSPNATVIIR